MWFAYARDMLTRPYQGMYYRVRYTLRPHRHHNEVLSSWMSSNALVVLTTRVSVGIRR